jgi:hypothetical protein
MEDRKRNIEILNMKRAVRTDHKKKKSKKRPVPKIKYVENGGYSPTFEERDAVSARLNSSINTSPYLTGNNSKYLKYLAYVKNTDTSYKKVQKSTNMGFGEAQSDVEGITCKNACKSLELAAWNRNSATLKEQTEIRYQEFYANSYLNSVRTSLVR